MPKLTEDALRQQIQTGTFLPAYWLTGDEAYMIHHTVKRLADALVGDHMPDMNLSRLTGERATPRAILEAADALPIMHNHRCVLVCDFVPGDYDEASLKELAAYLADPCPGNVVVFYFENVKPAATAKWKTIAAACETYGGTLALNRRTEAELVKLLCTGAGQRGCQMSAATAGYLVRCVGDDLNTLLRELEKLCAYRPGRRIEDADVDLMCSKTLTATAFEMVRQINRQNGKAALRVLQELKAQREEPVKIMAALASSYVNMYRALAADTAHRPAAAFAKELGVKNPNALGYALNDARRLGSGRLARSLALLGQQDEALKRLPVDGYILLEQTVVALMAVAKGAAR